MITAAELFTQCGQFLCSTGPRWKEQFASLLGIKANTADNMGKGDSRIPPGIWYAIIHEIRERRQALPSLEALSLAVADVARLRPILVNTDGTHIIRDGATELFRGPLAACRDWLDLRQEAALLNAEEKAYLQGAAPKNLPPLIKQKGTQTMPKYEYTIERVDEELSVTFETDVPLPNLAVGAFLNVVNDHLALPLGKVFEIRHMETYLALLKDSELTKARTYIWVQPKDRPSFLPRR